MRFGSIGCVYAVLFSDGWLKVGRGVKPGERITAHKSASSMRGATIEKSVISGVMVNSKDAERKLIGICHSLGKPVHGNEWFIGVDFEVIEEIFNSDFSGDSEEDIAADVKRCEKEMNDLSDKLFSIGEIEERGEFCSFAMTDWEECLAHAKIIEKSFLYEGYSGPIFEKGSLGLSIIVSHSALALTAMSNDDRVGMYHMVTEDPDEAMILLLNKGSEFIKGFKSGESK